MIKLSQKVQINLSLWLVLFVVFLDQASVGLVYPMFSSMMFTPESPFITSETSTFMKGSFLGILLSAMPLGSFFSGPILGTLSDQKGRRPLFIFCLSLATIGYVCSIFGILAQSLLILILSRVIVGLADGSMGVVSAAIADLSVDETIKAKNFGLYGMMSGVGFALGPLLGGILASFGFTIPFLAAGVTTLANLFLILWFFQETHKVRKSAPIRLDDGIRNLKKAFQIKNLRILFLTGIFFCIGWSFFYEFLPVIWIDSYGFDLTQVGFFFGFGAMCYALSSGLLIRPIVNRFKPSPVLFASLCGLGIAILLLLLQPSSTWIWVYLPITNFLIALIYPTYITMTSDLAGPDAQGEILGISGSLQAFAFALSPLAAGFLVGAGTYMPMLVGGLSTLLAGIVFSFRQTKQ